MTAFIIAEAGVNHNGDLDLALEMVDVAARCGADAIKFQTFSADKLVRPGAEKAEYQKRATGAGDQYAMLKSLELSESAHRMLYQRCEDAGIEFMSTAFDQDAADFLVSLGMRRIKVPSGEITNFPFLTHLAGLGRSIILSTGMADLDEVMDASGHIQAVWADRGGPDARAGALTILHCTSNYPTSAEDVNLRAMLTIGDATGMPVGYSDHTMGLGVATAAVALGAKVIEKHFTLDRALSGPDHVASLLPDELCRLVGQIRAVEACMGSPVKAPTASELPVRQLVRRSVTLTRDVQAGEILDEAAIVLLRPGDGIEPRDLNRVAGRAMAHDKAAGTTLYWSDLLA